MRYLAVFLMILFSLAESRGQSISISADGAPANASSILDIRSSTKGLLIPRMSQSERNMIVSPATGLLLFQTDNTPGYYYYNGTSWTPIVSAGGGSWSTTGNAGTNPATNFLGTTDNQPLMFRVNNVKAGEVNPSNGNIYLGINAGV